MGSAYDQAVIRKKNLQAEKIAKGGWRGRVDAKCIECIYDPLSAGNWRRQVEECTDDTCPLWDVRAKTTVKQTAERAQNRRPQHDPYLRTAEGRFLPKSVLRGPIPRV